MLVHRIVNYQRVAQRESAGPRAASSSSASIPRRRKVLQAQYLVIRRDARPVALGLIRAHPFLRDVSALRGERAAGGCVRTSVVRSLGLTGHSSGSTLETTDGSKPSCQWILVFSPGERSLVPATAAGRCLLIVRDHC
ncbi:hypothetical protein VTO42DRAFT_3152 [Malbranchea cinnamomea]